MSFKHPQQHDHKMSGFAAAAASKKTPPHLRPHLSKLAAGATMLKKAAGTMAETQKRLPNLMLPISGPAKRMVATQEQSKVITKQTAGKVSPAPKRKSAFYGA